MLGFYDYTVVLTYISFASAVSGIFLASSAHFRMAVFCLALSGLCDMFDGKVARTKKNRTDDEKSFGIQIDSLCDMVCFGVLPIVICYKLGMSHVYSMAILIFYGLAGLIRLAYFNVTEMKRQEESDDARKYYQGLPITSMAIALPVFFVLSPLIRNAQVRLGVLHVLVAAVGILFITNFRLRKPSPREVFILVGIVALAVVVIMFVWEGWLFFLHRYLYRFLGKTFKTAFLITGGIAV
ncbi:MAG: CDP-alcohol phosphatidyltransferase family protein [Lachnospiraceae bacterium]